MADLFFTSDMHFGHANIALYCNRPYIKPEELTKERKWAFPTAPNLVEERMEKDLIRRWNSRVKPEDTVIHVGDFCNRGNNRGVPGSRKAPEDYEAQLNGKLIYVWGNHDRNNGLKFTLDTIVMEVGRRLVLVQHHPIERVEEVPAFAEFVICGHVHELWTTKWVGGVCNVNVGTDVHGYAPIRQDEVIGIYLRECARVEKERKEAANVR